MPEQARDTKTTKTITDPDLILKSFKEDITKDADAMAEQRQEANEDMRFVNVTGGMWEDFLQDSYNGRTKLEFDLVSDFVNTFLGEWNQNRVSVEYKPDDSKTTDEDAELLNGIYRADYREYSGKLATDNAVHEVANCGYGCLKMAAVYEDEGDPENELQRIEFRPIHNAYSTVFWDRSAKRLDKRDARRCQVLTEYTKEGFEAEFPDKQAISAYTPESMNLRTSDGTESNIFIATRYEVVKKRESIFIYNNLETGKAEYFSEKAHADVKDELAKDDLREFARERKIIKQVVLKSVFSGQEMLEKPKRIAGKWIPIIPFYGYRSYVDGVEWYRGLIRKLKDAARLYNMQVSQLAENSASSGQEIPIFDPEQMEGSEIQNLWADKNNKPYMLARSLKDDNGNIIQHGPTAYLKPAQLDGSTTALMQIVPTFIQQTAGGAPQDTLDPDASGKAINALIKRENMKTQVVNDNIATASEWSGEVYAAIAAEVYTEARMVRTIGRDGVHGREQLSKIIIDEQTGRPVEANTLKGKKFRSYADAGPAHETMREQVVEDGKGMLQALKGIAGGEKYAPALISTIIENMVGVGLGPLKDMNRKDMLTQGLVKPETDEEKEFVEQAQEPKQDPQAELIAAAANQQNAEARQLDASSQDKIASAEKKVAEIGKINSETENVKLKTQMQIRDEILNRLSNLPLSPENRVIN
jgi:hypothetical protein